MYSIYVTSMHGCRQGFVCELNDPYSSALLLHCIQPYILSFCHADPCCCCIHTTYIYLYYVQCACSAHFITACISIAYLLCSCKGGHRRYEPHGSCHFYNYAIAMWRWMELARIQTSAIRSFCSDCCAISGVVRNTMQNGYPEHTYMLNVHFRDSLLEAIK